ncbi:hypothetical protein C0033_05315 [Clostridium sp. chh4-2]|uniref:ATP-grasp domain-containing protein n=1 Tax=Clostridium sp. chh4-2 TaxID=2067550 RepID=UPI000CCE0D82|nr:ATP-grasp domain-containing protein [Clostridium sp. chh4-2]PNV62955.1 hypothetical protein C0033_05315 [Clostridium sp. chh4-2]
MVYVLYPCDYFESNKVEPDYQYEYDEAVKFPDFHLLFYNYDQFVSGDGLKIVPLPSENGICIYRGWMLKPDQYEELYHLLKEKSVELINTPEAYENCHEFPLSYHKIEQLTPKTMVFPEGSAIDWDEVKENLGTFMMKDYVKSVKGTEFPQYFDYNCTNEMLEQSVIRFKELRGSLYTKGIVLKQFIRLKRYGETTNEYRAFYLDGRLLTLSPNSNQSKECNKVPDSFLKMIPKLDSRFYTIDFAETEDGGWQVIETGDGQVSGLSPNQYVFKFYDELHDRLCGKGAVYEKS